MQNFNNNSNNVSANKVSNGNISTKDLIERLYNFIYSKMGNDDYIKAKSILDNNERLLLYICFAYNTDEVLCNMGSMSLITNPNALFISREETSAFLETFKSLVRTVIEEEKENVADASNWAN